MFVMYKYDLQNNINFLGNSTASTESKFVIWKKGFMVITNLQCGLIYPLLQTI